MNRREFLRGALAATAASAIPAPGATATEVSGENGSGVITPTERRRKRFVNVALQTHEGKEVRFYDDLIKGKTVLINFIYTRCGDGSCPVTTAYLARVQQLLGERVGRDIFMYSITLDPEHDTPRVLKNYADAFRVKPGWLFLTGKKDDIERLRRNLGFVNRDPVLDKKRSQHLGFLRFGIEPLERWGGCPAMTNPEAIARYISWMEPKGERPQDATP